MFTLTAANALKLLSGMVNNVKEFHNAKEAKSSIATMNVYAPMDSCGIKDHAFILLVSEAKFGLAQSVSAQQVSILMAQCVYNVSMARSGMLI